MTEFATRNEIEALCDEVATACGKLERQRRDFEGRFKDLFAELSSRVDALQREVMDLTEHLTRKDGGGS